MSEEWRPIPGYDGYEASEFAKIRKLQNDGTFKVLHPSRTTDDYFTVNIRDVNGNKHQYTIHKLTCLAFHGLPDSSLQNPTVDHIDGNILNNQKDNLEWVSHSENVRRALLRNPKKKFKIKCFETGQVFKSLAECQRYFGFRYYTIYQRSLTGEQLHGYHFERIYEEENKNE